MIRFAFHPVRTAATSLVEAARDASADVPVLTTGQTGLDLLEPLMICTHEGKTAFYPKPGVEQVTTVVEAVNEGRIATDEARFVANHKPGIMRLPTVENAPLSVGCRQVLASCGWVDPVDPAMHDFLNEVAMEPIADIGVLGRGRGDAATDTPVSEQWTTARDAAGTPVVVVNANEADSRSLADELLLGSVPLTVLDSATTVAEDIGASDVIVYCNAADEWLHERVTAAIENSEHEFPVTPQVVTGPDTFRAGEATMALEAMEGADRIEARRRPPGPAEHGLYGRPTVLHTPRTFAQIYHVLTNPEDFETSKSDPGSRLVSVTGNVPAPVTVELDTDGELNTVLDVFDGSGESDFRTAVVGGQFGGFTLDLDIPAGGPSLYEAGFGTNGVVELFDESTCVVAELGSRTKFASAENCGRCVPCREGSVQLLEKLREVYNGNCDIEGLYELARVMSHSSICSFGTEAGRMVTTALDEFESEFRTHANGGCPSGSCEQ